MNITAIRIDATTRTVRLVTMGTALADFYREIGCSTIEAVHLRGIAPGDLLYVDEEGLLTPGKNFFVFDGYPQPIAGNGIIIGHDGKGDTISATTPLELVWHRVGFLVKQLDS
jgi:hypothetical protein